MNQLLEVKNINAGYTGRMVLKNISLSARAGELIGIIGPNGSGKSTLIRAMSRTLKPEGGEILLDGRDIYAISPLESARSIAVVPQDTLIAFEFLVRDIVMMGRIPHMRRFSRENASDLAAVEKAMELTETKNLSGRLINELSAGERQRVIIAKALAQEPRLLMLDEPTSHLDIGHQADIFDLVRRQCDRGSLSTIAVLHDLNLASEYCDRVLLLNNGLLIANGTPSEVINKKNIEEIYKAGIAVDKSPQSAKPHVFLVPKTRDM